MEPFQEKVPHHPNMSAKEFLLVTKEVESMLQKGAIQKTSAKKYQFLSNLLLVGKKDTRNRPVINLKIWMHPSLIFISKWKACICWGACWKRKITCANRPDGWLILCSTASGLGGPAPWIFTKLLKIPVAILRRINIRIAVYLDDMLLMNQTIDSLNIPTDTLIF